MNALKIVRNSPEYFLIHGDLTFFSINKTALKSFSLAADSKETVIDLTQVTSTDSAGLALILEWLKMARKQQTKLHFKNLPEQLLLLSRLSNLETIFSSGNPAK